MLVVSKKWGIVLGAVIVLTAASLSLFATTHQEHQHAITVVSRSNKSHTTASPSSIPSASSPSESPRVLSAATNRIAQAPAKTSQASQTTYQVNEQFNGNRLNPTLWQSMTYPAGYRNHEEEDYRPSQVIVSDGMLHIAAIKDASGQWHSGEVNSKWSYTYGDFEIRMALTATGPGVWPAAWLMGTTDHWPAGGELDMAENLNGQPIIYGTIHGEGAGGPWQLQSSASGIDVTKFHAYRIVKDPDKITWWVDGIERAQWTPSDVPAGGTWPFEVHSNFAIINLAIGGDWPGPSTSATPSQITLNADYFTVKNGR